MVDLCSIVVSMCIIIPVVSTYQYKIRVSLESELDGCQRINDTLHHCSSLIPMFQLLSNNGGLTDVVIQSGMHDLNTSYTLKDLHDVQLRSSSSESAVIMCQRDLNTGVAFIQVRNLIIDHLIIVGCGMRHTSTSYYEKEKFISIYSALFIQNSSDIFLMNVNISDSTGIGLLMYDTSGLVNITRCNFTHNKLSPLDSKAISTDNETSGGGIHIEFTNCTPGIASCDSNGNIYNTHSKYIINQCTFDGNAATYGHKSHEEKYFQNDNYITIYTGGGMSLWFNGQAKNNSVEVTLSNFIHNNATIGGGLNVHSRENATHNYVYISKCNFIGNVGHKEGGGLVIGNVIHQNGRASIFNTYTISDCWFEENQALTGGGVMGFGSRETQPTNHFEIHNSSFVGNKAQFGSAIQINRQFFDSIIMGSIFALVLKDCNFISNNLHENSSIGALAMSGVNVEFLGYNYFTNNTSTALMVDAATIKFGNDSVTVFQDNSGLHGGAILLIQGASIIVYPNSTVIFLRNKAVENGGAIYVELSTPFDYLLSHACFIRYYLETVLPSNWKTNFTFIDNTARQSNNSIFASTLQPCTRAYSNATELFLRKPFYCYPNCHNRISTLPVNFKFLNKDNKIINVVPGEIFNMSVILEDELVTEVDSALFIATCIESKSPNVLPPYQLTDGKIQIAGKSNETCHLELQTNTDYPASTTVQVNLLNCPPGLVYDESKSQCQCIVNDTPQIPAISKCEMTCLQAYYNKYYWIGYKSDDATDLIYGLCPYHFCYNKQVPEDQLLPRDANKTILDKFVCGGRKRTGVLCGQCIEGYSVMMNSPGSTCDKCSNVHLGILYLILSYILPVSVLFYIIMSYNIRMTTGVISAYLFFSQTVSSQYYYASLQADTDLSFTISNIVLSIYSMSNLEFFQHDALSYCLFSNAGTVDILAFKLLLSFYPLFLVLIYFLLRRYNYRICRYCHFQSFRLSSTSVTHGIAAFLVLCFAKINVLAYGISKYAELFYLNGTSYERVVYFQGDIKYFKEPIYKIYEIGSLITVIIIITIPTTILVFHPILISIAIYFEWGENKFVLLVNKILLIDRLKPVLDTFQGDYKDNQYFFAGLHFFLYRTLLYCIIVAASTADLNRLYLLITIYLLVIQLIHVLVMPFKKFINNAAYSLMYFIMIFIVIIEHYVFSTGSPPYELIWTEILLVLSPLVCIALYYSWKLFIFAKTKWMKKSQDRSDDPLPLVSTLFSIQLQVSLLA